MLCAQTRAVTAEEVFEMVKDAGYAPTRLEKKIPDRPAPIRFQVESANCVLQFYQCEKEACKGIQISAGFRFTEKPTLELINDFNRKKRYAAAFLDSENDPWLRLDFDFTGTQDFKDWLSFWRTMLGSYRNALSTKEVK